MSLEKVPLKLKSITNKAGNLLLSEYKDTRGIFLIGSTADGTDNKSSDIDLVCIKSRKFNYKKRLKIEEKIII